MRKTLTDKGVAALKPRAKKYDEPDPQLPGFYVRVMPSGLKTYYAVARNPQGKQIWTKVENAAVLGIEEARTRAREIIKRTKEGKPPVEPPPAASETFEIIADRWLERHVRAKNLRSQDAIVRVLKALVYPRWAKRPLISIRRNDIATLLDEIQDGNGPRQADVVLQYVRQIMDFHAGRDDNFMSPVVKTMRRHAGARARDRILDDDEIRDLWAAADEGGMFGSFVKILLLLGQRRDATASMMWSDLSPDQSVWLMASEERAKGTGGILQLPPLAQQIIRDQSPIGENAFVFPGRTRNSHISGYGKRKAEFDKSLPKMARWTLHDLRRTARSLLSRCGVSADISERVLGHAIPGIRGIYDRFEYRAEKADALARLASLILSIVGENVLPLRKKESV